MRKKIIEEIEKNNYFNSIDLHFAKFIEDLSGKEEDGTLALSAALVSRQLSEGHICIDLKSYMENNPLPDIPLPDLEEWKGVLFSSSVTGKPGEKKPLVFDGRRLYLYRYWNYEDQLIRRLKIAAQMETETGENIKDSLNRFFDNEGKEINWQKIAAFMALKKPFCVISGGPGTGKTTTVAKILCLFLREREDIKIALAAPTGKAAARMNEAIKNSMDYLKEKVSPLLFEKVKELSGRTIHRLLGSANKFSSSFIHNRENPLDYDVVIVDEASMIDLALMAKLFDALKDKCRLILLGDKDQLASVEAGAVIGSICNNTYINLFSRSFCMEYNNFERDKKRMLTEEYMDGSENNPLKDCIIQLKESYRFKDRKGIEVLSKSINRTAHFSEITDVFRSYKKDEGIAWHRLPERSKFKGAIKERVIDGFNTYIQANRPEEAIEGFNTFRILCALREGPFGVRAINLLIEEILKEEGFIEPSGKWYLHRPVMITRNDYTLNLFNGDTGITRKDEDGNYRVYFPSSEKNKLKKFIPSLLPDHETVFAMTVHKSQGSEFDHVLMILPDKPNPVLTRELIYTGITRAKNCIEIMACQEVFRGAAEKSVSRSSGLEEALWGGSL